VPSCVPLTDEGLPTTEPRSEINYAEDETLDKPDQYDEGDDFAEDDGFGDFDEFEEGGEGDDDFGDFDDGFQQGEQPVETSFDKPPDQTPVPVPPPGPVSLQQCHSHVLALPCLCCDATHTH